MSDTKGVFTAKKKDGSVYYRASITFKCRHISLGSFDDNNEAFLAYQSARNILDTDIKYLPADYSSTSYKLSFAKWICLINFKNNGIYIKTPIYLKHKYFEYYLSPTEFLLFDADDLFFYSNHSIVRRGNHLFVSEYGMQTGIASRYGIKNYARKNIDYRFVNNDDHDFRYSNIEILSSYTGVTAYKSFSSSYFISKIHINGDFIIGRYSSETKAAIAYNKAIDVLNKKGFQKNFQKNYIEELSKIQYEQIYNSIKIPQKIIDYKIK